MAEDKSPADKPQKAEKAGEADKKAPPKRDAIEKAYDAKTKVADEAKKPSKTVPEAKAKPEKVKKSGGGKFAWLLVFLLLFFIGGVAATPYLLPQVKPFLPEPAKTWFAALETPQGGADLSEITARLNQLDAGLKDVRQVAGDARSAAAEAAQPVEGQALDDGALAALSTRLDGLASQLEQVASAQSEQADSYARLQENLQALPTDGDSGISPAAIAALRGQLDDLASAQESLSETLSALEGTVSTLSDSVNAPRDDTASAEALSQVADALRARLSSLEERINVVSDAASSAADPEALAGVQDQVASQIAAFESRLGALENVRQQATAAMVAGLETARLAQAVSNGRAYAAELKALRQLKVQAGPALPDIADLLEEIAPFAESGIPSGATLAAQLEDRSREILTAIDTPPDAGWWERLLARLRNLVTIRQVGGPAGGNAPSDVLARAENAARTGDWRSVVSEIEAMPESARASLGPWWSQAQARATAQQVLADLSARLGVAVTETPGGAASEAGGAR